jgi:hypothetical protein
MRFAQSASGSEGGGSVFGEPNSLPLPSVEPVERIALGGLESGERSIRELELDGVGAAATGEQTERKVPAREGKRRLMERKARSAPGRNQGGGLSGAH